ncbi:MAG TPA: hypothetical protein VFV38_43250 [Ktedonobacteraceae bacterium]|nr:hypothetical protein [Ktedonobacteraceae bacterium]
MAHKDILTTLISRNTTTIPGVDISGQPSDVEVGVVRLVGERKPEELSDFRHLLHPRDAQNVRTGHIEPGTNAIVIPLSVLKDLDEGGAKRMLDYLVAFGAEGEQVAPEERVRREMADLLNGDITKPRVYVFYRSPYLGRGDYLVRFTQPLPPGHDYEKLCKNLAKELNEIFKTKVFSPLLAIDQHRAEELSRQGDFVLGYEKKALSIQRVMKKYGIKRSEQPSFEHFTNLLKRNQDNFQGLLEEAGISDLTAFPIGNENSTSQLGSKHSGSTKPRQGGRGSRG